MNTIAIDQQGRLVLPRPLRERLGLLHGEPGRLHVWESEDGVMIEAAPRESRIEDGSDGLPVLHISGVDEIHNETVVAAIREDRATR